MYRTRKDFNRAINLLEHYFTNKYLNIKVDKVMGNMYTCWDKDIKDIVYNTHVCDDVNSILSVKSTILFRYNFHLIQQKSNTNSIDINMDKLIKEFMNDFTYKSKDVYNASTLLYLNWSAQEEYKLKYNRPVPYLKELILNEFLNNY